MADVQEISRKLIDKEVEKRRKSIVAGAASNALRIASLAIRDTLLADLRGTDGEIEPTEDNLKAVAMISKTVGLLAKLGMEYDRQSSVLEGEAKSLGEQIQILGGE